MNSSLENHIKHFGVDIFSAIGSEQPSTFNKAYWSSRMMEWSMTNPRFKVNLFRLIDVLPTLSSTSNIASHINEYLAHDASRIHPLLGWMFQMKKNSLKGAVASYITKKSVQNMANDFIAGSTPKNALPALRKMRENGLSFTVDLLGEYCVSELEATEYLDRYLNTLENLKHEDSAWRLDGPIIEGHPGERSPVCISVKLSALYSQCSILNFERTVSILADRLAVITGKAAEMNAQIYVDAEDTGTNPMIYEAFKSVFDSPRFQSYPYPGIVVQAYALEARSIIEDLISFAKKRGGPIAIRLVKGAYWDAETINAKQNNWPSPLFANKESSDANFESLSRLLVDNKEHVLPAFASHNIRSLSHACCYAEHCGLTKKEYELQMLYGMAAPIAQTFSKKGYLVRLYTPVGELIPGMGYLVRRLLENTSNESFLRHTFFENDKIDSLLKKPEMRG